MERTILHVDMNAFYASVEELHRPELRAFPLAVGGDESRRHGIILAKNEAAKAAGVRTGEALWEAREKCPDLRVVPPNFPLYLRYAELSRRIYGEYTQKVEPFGLDEAWLDVTGSDGVALAETLRLRIKEELGVSVSIGISWCKVFAKLGSDLRKPDACTLISRENYRSLVWPLPISCLLYVGPAGTRKLRALGVSTIGQLAALPERYLRQRFGKLGLMLHQFANGSERGAVSDYVAETEAKSVGNSVTAARDLCDPRAVKIVLYSLCESVAARLREAGLAARGVELTVRRRDLSYLNARCRLARETDLAAELAEAGLKLFAENYVWNDVVRALGIRATALQPALPFQQAFFHDERRRRKLERLEKTVDTLRGRYGFYSLGRALMLCDPEGNIDAKHDHIIAPAGFLKSGARMAEGAPQ